jgi:RNA polymerase sigma-70 factor (ECF subfamily)
MNQDFEQLRPLLVRLAYRLLGSVSDAEDAAQETFVRYRLAGQPALDSPRAWFVRTCTRLCLDQLKSAHRSRTTPAGDALPEPLVEEAGPREAIDESVSMALLLLLRRLRPTERAVFLLHDVLEFEFEDVASALDLEVDNCRQIASRARRFLREPRARATPSTEEVRRMHDAFFAAAATGDVEALRALLTEEVVMRSDGGGKVASLAGPLVGREAVIAFLATLTGGGAARLQFQRRAVWFNGAPGTLVTDAEGRPVSAFQLETSERHIVGIFVQRDPDKLRTFGSPS